MKQHRNNRLKRTLILTLAIMLIVSACGAGGETESTPTINATDLQSTIVVAAFTLVAETQAAIPTSTLSPTVTMTNTPAFTPTIPPLPTLGATFTASPVPNPYAGDPCIDSPLPAALTGEKIKMRIDNPTKAAINLTVYLQSGNPQGICGYRGYLIPAGGSLVIADLIEGCYSLWAWNPDPKDYFMVTNGTSCLDKSNNWTFDITPNGINLRN